MVTLPDVVALIGSAREIREENTSACVSMMKEYLRREALWASELDLIDEIPFANLPATYGCGNDAEEMHQGMLTTFTYSLAEDRCCSAMLNWYGCQSSIPTESRFAGLPDPYLPLLHFFRSGGTFMREHRVFIYINTHEMIHSPDIQKGDLSSPYLALDE